MMWITALKSKIKQNKSLLAVNLVLFLFLLIMLCIKPVNSLRKYSIYNHHNGEDCVEVYGEKTASQVFECPDVSDCFEIYAVPANDQYHGRYKVELSDADGNRIGEWTTDKLDTAYGWVQYEIKNAVMNAGGKYKLDIMAPDLDKEDAILVYTCAAEEKASGTGEFAYTGEEGSSDDERKDRTLSFGIYRKCVNIFAIAAILVLFAGVNICFVLRNDIKWFSLAVLLTAALVMFFIMAPGSGPDDKYHYYSSMKLSNILMARDNAYEIENRYRSDLPTHYNTNKAFVEEYEGLRYSIRGEEGTYIHEGRADKLKQPLSHLAQALGITLGRILGLGFIRIYTLGRLFNMLFYIMLAWMAVRIVPVNKELMLMIGIMPMSMQQATQLSYDAPVNGLTMVFIAYIFKLMHEKKQIGWKNVLIITALLVMIAPLKVIYVILGLLLILFSKDQFGSIYDRIIKTAIPAGAALLVMVLSRSSDVTRVVNHTSRINNYNIGFMLSHPLRFAGLIAFNSEELFWTMIKGMIGGSLSGFTVNIPEYLTMAFLIVLLICASAAEDKIACGVKGTVIMTLTGVLGYLAVMTVFAFSETQYGSLYIEGIQGRYLIPFLPVVMYCLCGRKIKTEISRLALFVPIAFIEAGYITSVMNNIAF